MKCQATLSKTHKAQATVLPPIIHRTGLLKWARNEGIIWSFHWELPICPSYTFLGNCFALWHVRRCPQGTWPSVQDRHTQFCDAITLCMTSVPKFCFLVPSPLGYFPHVSITMEACSPWLCLASLSGTCAHIQPQENTARTLDSKGDPYGLPGASQTLIYTETSV